MKISFVGCGKLGLPIALAIESKGHDVVGYDPNSEIAKYLEQRKVPYKEHGLQELLDKTKMRMVELSEAVKHAEVLFVVVQTPHDPRYEGTSRMPHERKDFDYSYLIKAVWEIVTECKIQDKKNLTLVVMSTVLPGTMQKHILPILQECPAITFVYNPAFAAMGTVVYDFLAPEFVLLGSDKGSMGSLYQLYSQVTRSPIVRISIESAELTKVAYNNFISMKIVFANTMMEICHKTPGASVDEVSQALSHATRRLWSPAYTRGGVSDGGNCHPRDNIAMSWLANQLDLSTDPFRYVTRAREDQSDFLASIVAVEMTSFPQDPTVVIMGKAYKPETNLTGGSPSLLLKECLSRCAIHSEIYDPHIDGIDAKVPYSGASLFIIATKHEIFKTWPFPKGSVVIDPHRYIPEQDGIRIVQVGVNKKGDSK